MDLIINHSLNIKNFKSMITKIRKIEEILGLKIKRFLTLKKKNIPIIRKSIFAKKKIKKNEKISFKNIKTLRPVIGIPAENIFKILNKKAKNDIFKNQPLFQKNIK